MVDAVQMERSEKLSLLRRCRIPDVQIKGRIATGAISKSILRCIDDHIDHRKPPNRQVCWASAETIAAETGWCERTTRRSLQALVEIGVVEVTTRPGKTAEYRINWDWVGSHSTPDPRAPLTHVHPGTEDRTPRTHVQDTPDPRAPEPKRNRKGTVKGRSLNFTPQDRTTAEWFWERVKQTTGTDSKPPDFDRWANAIRLIREDGQTPRTDADVRAALNAAHADSFWSKNILSPDKLRQKWTAISALRKGSSVADPSHKPWRGSRSVQY